MNPRIPADYDEVGRWLGNFATAHAKREDPRAQAFVDSDTLREKQSYALHIAIGPTAALPPEAFPIELSFAELADRRGRFDGCAALAQRIREAVRHLQARSRPGESRPA